MGKSREQLPKKATWNLEKFFESKEMWEQKYHQLQTISKEGWDKLEQFRGKIQTATDLKKLLDSYFAVSRTLDQVYTYAHLRHDEDVAEDVHKISYNQSLSLFHEFSQATSWIEPEILKMEESTFQKYLIDPGLKPYKFFLEKLYHQKQHVLSDDQERILAMSMRAQMTPKGAYSALSNVDLQFPNILDGEGKSHKLTQSSYQVAMKSRDRTLRENAFKTLHRAFGAFENTICELISGHVEKHLFHARVRNYKSCLEAALKPHNIPVSVYHTLINTVREHLSTLHHYVDVRKKVLGLKELHFWDMTVPLVAECDMKFSYDEACDIVIQSVLPLGKEYQSILEKGIKEDRWVDVYESKGKRTGAYSSGCYDSMPYILMNFQGTLQDVLTLSHEAGHSMNSLLSNRKQTYHEAQYPIFIAEVASTFNEQLTYAYLLEKAQTKKEKLFILNQQIDGIRTTLFRQTMFAEFELKMHELAEKGVPLTPTLLKSEYHKLNEAYFGPSLVIDKELDWEFLRIPHFYSNFYVYQYATGIAAAAALVEHVKKKGNVSYLEFISSGGNDYPIEMLKKAGVDMCKAEPIETLLKTFHQLVTQFEASI